jgi:hypothetical protein
MMEIREWRTPYLYVVQSQLRPSADEDGWNDWYDHVHIPDLLTVPGIQSATRYAQRGGALSYLAVYEIESPGVFDHPRYAEVTGWGGWQPHVLGWTRTIARVERDEVKPHSVPMTDPEQGG